MPRSRSRTAALVAAGVVVAALGTLVGPPPAAVADSGIGRARQQLEATQHDLADIEARLQAAKNAVSAADAGLARATASLAALDEQRTAAEQALRDARAREREAAARLAVADGDLDARLAAWEASRRRLDDEVADAYMHGGTTHETLLLHGLISASDFHEATVAIRTVATLLDDQRSLVQDTKALTRDATVARREVARLRAAAVTEQRAAQRQQQRIAGLQTQQQRLVDTIAAERADRQTVLDRVAADRVATAVLVQQLQDRVAAMQRRLDAAVVDMASIPFDGPTPDWAVRLPARGRPWAAAINAAAAAAGVDGRLMAALVWTESDFTPTAVSRVGAVGLAQLMPDTAAGLGVDPHDPLQNLVGGARFLRAMIDRFHRVDLGLAAYNAGPGRVQRAGNRVPDIVETQLYVIRVLEHYEHIVGG